MIIKYLPHTADIRMAIESKTIKGLFATAVKGMGNILKEGYCDQRNVFSKSIRITTHSLDYTSLLIDFLSDVLSLGYIENSVYCKLEIEKLSKKTIVAKAFGFHVDQFDEEIKAVTHHEANILKNKRKKWETCIVFDI
ncbi:SHS2 domain-containing protein [Saonia flava]|uniref:SHS2 domain-containing protein n=1 Tax=Saonia flava TaxID=523696 RepID=A0A846QTV6_9FLAO|nr:archease [Saonia flava]NJB70400.1 SHS2 domain-containing protein [Saonia flava]